MTQGFAYRPTEEQRRTVRAMSGYGIPQEDIATFFDIDAKTLRKHFRNEIDKGSIEATSKVAQSLFRMATEGKNVAAAIFWMKARAGWREKHPQIDEDEPTRPTQIAWVIIDPELPKSPPDVIDGSIMTSGRNAQVIDHGD
jgi:hypothetical protein